MFNPKSWPNTDLLVCWIKYLYTLYSLQYYVPLYKNT